MFYILYTISYTEAKGIINFACENCKHVINFNADLSK